VFYAMNSSIWVRGLRIFAWIGLCVGVVGSIVAGVQVSDIVKNATCCCESGLAGFIGFLAAVAGMIGTFLGVALIMVFLDMAADIATIRKAIGNGTPNSKKEKPAINSDDSISVDQPSVSENEQWASQGLCRHCGGVIGSINPKCKTCGMWKDYT
jgi:hypothetical protein